MNGHDDATPEGPRDDVRVVDVLTAEAPQEVDPALVASLHAWFEGPAMGLEQVLEQVADDDDGITFDDVDPLLYDKLERRRGGDDMLRWSDQVPTLGCEHDMSRFRLQLSLPSLETKERELPWQLHDALNECTPQSLLRDLARIEPPAPPAGRLGANDEQGITVALDAAHQRVIEAMGQRYSTKIRCATEVMNEGLAELQAILDAPWEDSRPEEPARYLSMSEVEALMREMGW